ARCKRAEHGNIGCLRADGWRGRGVAVPLARRRGAAPGLEDAPEFHRTATAGAGLEWPPRARYPRCRIRLSRVGEPVSIALEPMRPTAMHGALDCGLSPSRT